MYYLKSLITESKTKNVRKPVQCIIGDKVRTTNMRNQFN